jgi:acyl-CoA thioesterase-1
MKNILFFGDSLTAGYGLKDVNKESFPALIQGLIEGTGKSYRVINAGLSGDTSESGRLRLKYVINQPVEIFVLALGANDLLRGIPPENTYSNLKTIIELVKNRHPAVKIVLIGMELPAWIPGKRVADFRGVFRRLATEYTLAFVPFLLARVGGISHLNMPDGIHPLAEGYQIIAQTVWEELKKLL